MEGSSPLKAAEKRLRSCVRSRCQNFFFLFSFGTETYPEDQRPRTVVDRSETCPEGSMLSSVDRSSQILRRLREKKNYHVDSSDGLH
jgi:hypothetical protein